MVIKRREVAAAHVRRCLLHAGSVRKLVIVTQLGQTDGGPQAAFIIVSVAAFVSEG